MTQGIGENRSFALIESVLAFLSNSRCSSFPSSFSGCEVLSQWTFFGLREGLDNGRFSVGGDRGGLGGFVVGILGAHVE